MASEEKSCQASAISSAGSPTMTTGLRPSTATTRTARPTSCGRTSLREPSRRLMLDARRSPSCGDTTVSWPIGSMNMMRTWRRCLSCKRQLLIELVQAALRGEILDGGGDEALGHFERGLDLDPRRRAGIEDRDGAGEKCRKKIDHPHRDKKLGADRPVIPKLLQHAWIVSTTRCAPPHHIGVNLGAIPIFVDHPLVFAAALHSPCLEALAGSRGKMDFMSEGEK